LVRDEISNLVNLLLSVKKELRVYLISLGFYNFKLYLKNSNFSNSFNLNQLDKLSTNTTIYTLILNKLNIRNKLLYSFHS